MSHASSSQSRIPGGDGVSWEIVRAQTVRAPIPTAPAGMGSVSPDTVRTAMPEAPPSPSSESPMVPRSWIDTPADPHAAALALEDVEVLEELEPEDDLGIGRADPPAVCGEVIATEDPPSRGRRRTTLRTGEVPDVRRSDPRSGAIEAGAVEVPVVPMGSDLIPTSMSSSGPQVIVGGFHQRPTTDPGSLFVRGFSEVTGPQPVAQAEATGPHPIMGQRVRDDSSSNALWILAGFLVLLAASVLGFVLTR